MSDLAGCHAESDLAAFPGEEPGAAPASSRPAASRSLAVPPRQQLPTFDSLDDLRAVGSRLARAYGRLEEQCQEVDGRSAAALETLTTIERRAGALENLRDLSSAIDERFASLARIDGELTARTAALQAQQEIVGSLEDRAARALSDANAAGATLAALERQLGPAAADLDRRTSEVGAQERRLAGIGAAAAALDARLDQLRTRVAELAAPAPELIAAEANVTELRRLAAEAAAQLEQLRSEKTELKRVLAETRAELRRVGRHVRRLSFTTRLRRRVAQAGPRLAAAVQRWARRAWRTTDWGSVRSTELTPALVTGLATIAIVAILAPVVVEGPDDPPVLEATARLEVVDAAIQTVTQVAPRTTDIHLPATRGRAVSARAGSERARISAAAADGVR